MAQRRLAAWRVDFDNDAPADRLGGADIGADELQ